MEQFRVGEVLGKSLDAWVRHFVPFFLLVAVMRAPMVVVVWKIEHGSLDLGDTRLVPLLLAAAEVFLSLLASGGITYGVFQTLRGQPMSLARCFGAMLKSAFAILRVELLIGVILVFAVVGLSLLAGLMSMLVNPLGPGVQAIAMLLLVGIPLVMLILRWYVVVPCVVVEEGGAVNALHRSNQLMMGSRAAVFGLLFLVVLIETLVALAVAKMLPGDGKLAAVLLPLGSVAAASFNAVLMAVTYNDLRVFKEGVDTNELAKVFE
jgi:hypothetical protein